MRDKLNQYIQSLEGPTSSGFGYHTHVEKCDMQEAYLVDIIYGKTGKYLFDIDMPFRSNCRIIKLCRHFKYAKTDFRFIWKSNTSFEVSCFMKTFCPLN